MNSLVATEPALQALYVAAAAQEGLFTTRQAATAGYSPPLLAHDQKAGRIVRIRRGIYRLLHFPPGEHEELVAAWLWTDAQGFCRTRRPCPSTASPISCPRKFI